jgi:hypothetical protein
MPNAGSFQKGHAKVGGKKKGTPNKKTVAARQALQDALTKCGLLPDEIATMTPLAAMMVVMRHRLTAADYDGALAAAREAAPYLHPRLSQQDLTVHNVDQARSDADLKAELAEIQAKMAAAETRH